MMDIQNTNEASNKLFKDEQDKNHKATLEKLTEIVRAAQKAMRDEELDQLRAQLAAQAEQISNLQMSLADTEALRQRVKELLQMITDQDYEYNRKTNALIKRHADQLATQAEQIKVAREGFERLSRLGLKDEWSNCIGSQP